uniref:Putative ovule protein n=1 Tax=Solanum chacoense TaxID=4108 RepID=A0A0V0HB53_SOLCH
MREEYMKIAIKKSIYVNHEFKKEVLIRTIIEYKGMKQKNKISRTYLHNLFLCTHRLSLADNRNYIPRK